MRFDKISSEKYVGSNAFGATREVQKISATQYGLAMPLSTWLFSESKGHDPDFIFLFEMPADQASALKRDAEIVLVCNLKIPWLYPDVHGHDATLDDPNESQIEEKDLTVVPLRIWIVNKQTGAIVKDVSQFSLARDQVRQQQLTKRLTH